eukprot:gene8599-11619_t
MGEKVDQVLPTTVIKTHYSTFSSIMSCVLYTGCSVSMVLLNKYISTSIPIQAKKKLPELSIILFQCLIAVVLVESARILKIVEYPPFNFRTARAWLPLNIIFIGMLSSGFVSLVYNSVPMVTIFKNLTNLVTVAGDWYLFGEHVSWLTIVSIVVMTFGAVMSGANDLEFTLVGYSWMALNCIFTSSYTLYMRFASTNINLPKFGMVFYNNVLSAAILFPFCVYKGEFQVLNDPQIMTSQFIILNVLAGLIGFYLNFASLWCVASTSATTYAIVGSLNKVPITVLGFILFQVKMTERGIVFVTLATLGGFLYAYAKLPK